MDRYVAFSRGINVSRHKRADMAGLRQAFAGARHCWRRATYCSLPRRQSAVP
ncbi:MAG: DUF1697 domain-containing protein, partial [Chloroflexi bacterium]|nr:DUF1697 domain-containing protein [Chloroflexota bacterium]